MYSNISSIDIAKYVASLCVVAIHIYTTYPIENTAMFLFINGIARLAVPFFFCCTGYFLAQKGIEKRSVALPYIIKLLKIYFVWSLVYIPIEFLKMIGTNTFDLEHILKYLHTILVDGTFIHLWYFPATILAVGLLHFLIKRLSLKSICLISIILYFIGMLGDGYAKVIYILPKWLNTLMLVYKSLFITTRNGLFFGLPLVLMGILIYRYKDKICKINIFPWLILSLIGTCTETYLLNYYNIAKDYNMIISIIPSTLFLFCCLLQINTTNNYNSSKWRYFSSLIYESHLIFYGFVLVLLRFYNIDFLNYKISQYLIVLGLSHLFSLLILHSKKYFLN